MDESEQKVLNNSPEIKMTQHLYCMNYSNLFAFLISTLTVSIVGHLQNGYQPYSKPHKVAYFKSLTLCIRSKYKKLNAVQMSLITKLSAI